MFPMMCSQPACMNIPVKMVIHPCPLVICAGITAQRSTNASPPSSSSRNTHAFAAIISAVTHANPRVRRDASPSGSIVPTSLAPFFSWNPARCAPEFNQNKRISYPDSARTLNPSRKIVAPSFAFSLAKGGIARTMRLYSQRTRSRMAISVAKTAGERSRGGILRAKRLVWCIKSHKFYHGFRAVLLILNYLSAIFGHKR